MSLSKRGIPETTATPRPSYISVHHAIKVAFCKIKDNLFDAETNNRSRPTMVKLCLAPAFSTRLRRHLTQLEALKKRRIISKSFIFQAFEILSYFFFVELRLFTQYVQPL